MRLGLSLLTVALLLIGCPVNKNLVETAASPEAASPEAESCTWTTAFSGRFHMEPRSAWLDSGVVPLNYAEAHWWVEVELKNDQSKTPAVCSVPPKDREDGAGTCISDNVGAVDVLESTRTMVLGKLVSTGLLPEEGLGYSVFPQELYRERLYQRMVEQNIDKRFGGDAQFCRVRLHVRALKTQTADGNWWDQWTMYFPEDAERCCK